MKSSFAGEDLSPPPYTLLKIKIFLKLQKSLEIEEELKKPLVRVNGIEAEHLLNNIVSARAPFLFFLNWGVFSENL